MLPDDLPRGSTARQSPSGKLQVSNLAFDEALSNMRRPTGFEGSTSIRTGLAANPTPCRLRPFEKAQ